MNHAESQYLLFANHDKYNCWICILFLRPHGDPQMMRFGAHLVLVLRYLHADQMKDTFKEKIMTVGDLIIHM